MRVLPNGAVAFDLSTAARCGARTRAGGDCLQPAMRSGKCRMHGGASTGPRTGGRARRPGQADARIVQRRRANRDTHRLLRAMARALLQAQGLPSATAKGRKLPVDRAADRALARAADLEPGTERS